jgi:SNF2 family DNA or RNA helicase
MGQTRAVQVFRLIVDETLDMNVARLALRKLELDRALKGAKDGTPSKAKAKASADKSSIGELLAQALGAI